VNMRAIIVGAGIYGLLTALHLRKEGVDVVVLERGSIPNPSCASVDRDRMIRAAHPGQPGLTRRVADAYAEWSRLSDELGKDFYIETGTLTFASPCLDFAERSLAELEAAGLPYERLSPNEVSYRYPVFRTDDVDWALYTRDGGVLRAGRIVGAVAERLGELGGVPRPHSRVQAVSSDGRSVTLMDGTVVSGDAVLVCAGAWVPELLPEVARDVRPIRQEVAYVAPPDDLTAAWTRTPCFVSTGQAVDGWGLPPLGGLGVKVGAVANVRPSAPENGITAASGTAETLWAMVGPRFARWDEYRPTHAVVCHFTLAPNEAFILRPFGASGLLVSCCSGSGFKFSSLVTREIADAILGKRSLTSLAEGYQ
jgi:sarcosine oxidase